MKLKALPSIELAIPLVENIISLTCTSISSNTPFVLAFDLSANYIITPVSFKGTLPREAFIE